MPGSGSQKAPPSRNDILAIIEADYGYGYRRVQKLYPEFCADLMSGGVKIAEALYIWLHGRGFCECGNPTGFEGLRNGYRSHCSSKCAAGDASVKAAKRETTVDRYGSAGPLARPDIQAKFKATMVARHGVEHALRSPDLLAKASRTFAERFPEGSKAEASLKARREQTNIDRFGTPHPTQNAEVRAKVVATVRERYGVDTPLVMPNAGWRTSIANRRARFLARLRDRSLASGIEPLFDDPGPVGQRHPWRCLTCSATFSAHMDDGKLPACPICFPGGSKGEAEMIAFIASHDIPMTCTERSLIAPFELDVVLPDRSLAFEYDGLYWHSEDKVGRTYHNDKTQACATQGIRLVHVFENEWLQKRAIVESRIRNLLGFSERIHARKTRVVPLSSATARQFFDDNHIQGSCPVGASFGLVLGDDLIAAMSFGRSRYAKNAEWELLRFANRLGHTVVGGAARLLAAFDREHRTPSLVSYSDRRWNSGALYRNLGFAYTHSSPPNYFYTQDGLTLLSRIGFQKHKLAGVLDVFDPKLSEAVNMRQNGYKRIFDCGTDVFLRA